MGHRGKLWSSGNGRSTQHSPVSQIIFLRMHLSWNPARGWLRRYGGEWWTLPTTIFTRRCMRWLIECLPARAITGTRSATGRDHTIRDLGTTLHIGGVQTGG